MIGKVIGTELLSDAALPEPLNLWDWNGVGLARDGRVGPLQHADVLLGGDEGGRLAEHRQPRRLVRRLVLVPDDARVRVLRVTEITPPTLGQGSQK